MAINAGTAIAYLTLDHSKFSSGFQQASKDMDKFKGSVNTTQDKIKGVGQTMTTVGGTLTKSVTLPLGGVGAAALKVSTDFEKGMAQVQAISGATGSDFDKLRDTALEMGNKTKFSASESAEAMQYMAMAGWKSKEMVEGIEPILNLAAAGNVDLATTSDIVTDALTGFGLKAKDTEHFVDVMAATMANSNTDVQMLGESFKYVAPVAGAMGYKVEDVSVALGLMANSGIKATQAGTSLRSLITRMAKPTKESQEALDKLGITLDDGAGNMKSFRQIMDELRAGFGNIMIPQEEYNERLSQLNSDLERGAITQKEYDQSLEDLTRAAYGAEGAEKARYAAMLAGQEGMSGLMAIVGAAPEDYEKLTGAIDNSTGATQRMVDIMMNTLSGAIDIFKSSLESAGIEIGETLIPIIRDLAEWLTDIVEWFINLDSGTQEFIVKAGLLAVALGPVIGLFGNLLKIGGSLFSVFGTGANILKTGVGLFAKLGSSAGTAGTALATAGGTATKAGGLFSGLWGIISAHPIGALITVIGLLLFKCEWFRDGIMNILKFLGDKLGGAFKWIGEKLGLVEKDTEEFEKDQREVYGKWSDNVIKMGEKAGAKLEENTKKSQDKTQKNTEEFKSKQGKTLKGWADNVTEIGKKAGANFEKETKQSQDNTQKNTEKFKTMQSRTMGTWMNDLTGKAKQTGENVQKNTKTSQNNVQSNTTTFVNNQIKTHGAWKNDVVNKSKEAAESMERNMKISSHQVNQDIETMKNKSEGTMANFVNSMARKGRETGAALGDGIDSGKIQVNNSLNRMANEAYSNLNKFNKGMNKCGQNAMTSFVNGLSSGMSSVKKLVGNLANMGQTIAANAWNSVNGRHATGLSYVPFDGYIAELHRGERVLTAKENEGYNRREISTGDGDTFNFYNTKPEPYEYARQMKKAKRELLYNM